MAIVAGFDVHRAQITFDALDGATGEVHRGRMASTPEAVRDWVARFPGMEVDVAVEAGTRWLFVCEALTAAGAVAHLAEPAEMSALRGPKRRAKTDPRGRALAAHPARRRLARRVLDPARARARVAHTHPPAQDARRRAHALARARPGDAVSARHRRRTRAAAVRPGREFLAKLDLPPAALERIE